MGKVSSFTDWETGVRGHTAAWKSARFQFGDPLAMPHRLPPIPDSNAYSQGLGNFNSDGEPQVKVFVIRSQFSFDIQDAGITDFHPVQKREFTRVTPRDGHLLSTAFCQHCAKHLVSSTLPTLVFTIALFRGLIVSILWHGILKIRQMRFPPRF